MNNTENTALAPTNENAAPEAAEIPAINAFEVAPGLGGVGRPPLKIAVKNIPSVLNLFHFAAPSQTRRLTPTEIAAKVKELNLPIEEMIAYVQNPKNSVETVCAGIKSLKEWKKTEPDTEIFITKTQLKKAMSDLADVAWDAMAPEKPAKVEKVEA